MVDLTPFGAFCRSQQAAWCVVSPFPTLTSLRYKNVTARTSPWRGCGITFQGLAMAEKHSISRTSDADQGTSTGQEERNLTLTGICTQDDRQCASRTRQSSSNDNYIDFGPTGRDAKTEADRGRQTDDGTRNRDANCRGERISVRQGETLWKLAEEKYGGKHPLEAIYAANGMYPKVADKNGKIEMTDPVYGPGKYVLPDEKDIPQLTRQYRQHVEEQGRSSDKRVGGKDEATDVKIIYGDTFERMSRVKYGHEVPPEAIYAANNLQPRNVDGCLKEPIYYAGKTYTLPAEKDIPDLVRQYWEKCGHPEKCPQQYRQDGGSTGTDNYGNAGETSRPTDGRPPARQPEGGEKRDTKYYNEGYEDGYKDGIRRGKACACGGGGCEACRGKGHQQHREERREHIPAPAPERREPVRGGCQNCGGGGCESCRGRTHREHREPVVIRGVPRVDAGCPNCGGNGCNACMGRRDQRDQRDHVVYQQDRYYDRQRQGIDAAVPLAIMGMVLNGIVGGHRHHGYDNWNGGYGRQDYGREAWEQQRNREIWQRQHQYNSNQYDSEYGYGRRNQRYQQYQYQQYRNRHWSHQGW
jgi:hypothetical protein